MMFPLKAVVKVRNPANHALVVVHGGMRTLTPSRASLEFLTPEASGRQALHPEVASSAGWSEQQLGATHFLSTADLGSLKTLLLSNCNVLDLYDYNNNEFAAEDPLSRRTAYSGTTLAPGQLWWRGTGRGRTILLGYNFPVVGGAAGNAVQTYLAELDRLASLVPPDKLQQLAWISANLTEARKPGAESALNACAWDADSYYYIAYFPPLGRENPELRREPRRILGVFRIPLVDGDNQVIQPNKRLQKPGGEEISIPGTPLAP